MSNSYICPTERTLSTATIPIQNGPGGGDNKGVFRIRKAPHYLGLIIVLSRVISRTHVEGRSVTRLQISAVGVFCSLSYCAI